MIVLVSFFQIERGSSTFARLPVMVLVGFGGVGKCTPPLEMAVENFLIAFGFSTSGSGDSHDRLHEDPVRPAHGRGATVRMRNVSDVSIGRKGPCVARH